MMMRDHADSSRRPAQSQGERELLFWYVCDLNGLRLEEEVKVGVNFGTGAIYPTRWSLCELRYFAHCEIARRLPMGNVRAHSVAR